MIGGMVRLIKVKDIPATTGELKEGTSAQGLPEGCLQMFNETNIKPSYFGPGPPAGTGVHHYIITLYALDTVRIPPGNGFESFCSVVGRIEPHILSQASYQGTFQTSDK